MKKALIVVLVLVAIAATACYFLMGSSSEAAHQSLIPDDAKAVAIINAKEAIKETGIKLEAEKVEKIQAGLDFMQPIYAYLTESGCVGLAAAISDSKKLESNLSDIRQNEGYTWGMMNDFIVCHDGSKVLMFGPNVSWEDQKVQKEMLVLMGKKTTTSALFEDLKHKDGAIKAKISMAAASQFAKDEMEEVKAIIKKNMSIYTGEEVDIDIESLVLDLAVKATENSIALTAAISSSDAKTNELLAKYAKKAKPVTHKMDKYIIENPSVLMCMNIDGPAILDVLMKDATIASQINMINSMVNVSEILRSINGDAVVMAGNMDTKDMELGMVVQVTDSKFLNKQLKQTMELLNIRSGEYGDKSDKAVYLANNPAMEQKMSNGGYKAAKEDGYTDDCIFFLSMNPGNMVQMASEYNASIAPFASLAADVDRLNIRATQDNVEWKIILKTTINDYVNKWIE